MLFYGTYFLGIGLRLAFEASEQNVHFSGSAIRPNHIPPKMNRDLSVKR